MAAREGRAAQDLPEEREREDRPRRREPKRREPHENQDEPREDRGVQGDGDEVR
jgi:hypothetical protein